jgi:hypothetical protein
MVDEFADPAQRRLDLDKLHLIIDAIQHWYAHLDFDKDALAQDASLFARLLVAYNQAYYGDLTFAIAPVADAGAVRGVVQLASRGFVADGAPSGFPASPPPRKLTRPARSNCPPLPSTPGG